MVEIGGSKLKERVMVQQNNGVYDIVYIYIYVYVCIRMILVFVDSICYDFSF